MIRIEKATPDDAKSLAKLGSIAWVEAHGRSASPKDIESYVKRKYTEAAIFDELKKPTNQYHLIYWNDQLAGFSNIILNAPDPNVAAPNAAELDRLYLLREFYDRKLGLALLQFNIDLAKKHEQVGLWLYVWKGNDRALAFYSKAGFKIIGSHDFQISDSHSNPNHQMYLAL